MKSEMEAQVPAGRSNLLALSELGGGSFLGQIKLVQVVPSGESAGHLAGDQVETAGVREYLRYVGYWLHRRHLMDDHPRSTNRPCRQG